MADSYTSVTRQGYFERIGNAIKGVVVGLVLFVISFPLLFWNEGRAVGTANQIAEVEKQTVSVAPAKVDTANDGKPVHFTGNATGQALTDPEFGVSQTAI